MSASFPALNILGTKKLRVRCRPRQKVKRQKKVNARGHVYTGTPDNHLARAIAHKAKQLKRKKRTPAMSFVHDSGLEPEPEESP